MNLFGKIWRCSFIAAVIALGGCTQEAQTPSPEAAAKPAGTESKPAGEKLRVGVMPKLVGIDYFNAVEKGAKEAATELGIELTWDGPVNNDVTKQIEMIDNWISQKFDVIAVAPNDPSALAPTLKEAMKRGIKVLTYDSDSTEDSRQYFVNQATGESIGFELVDVMAEQIGSKGKTAIVSGSMTAANQNLWIGHMKRRVAEKYPEMIMDIIKPSEEDQQLAVQVTQDLIKANPDLKGVFGITSVALPGAAQAVKESGNTDKIAVTGLSTPKSMAQFVDDGTVDEFILWNPVDLGYLTVQVAKQVAASDKLPEKIDAGRLKDIVVTGTQVLLGPPTRFNKDNIKNFDF